jgi:hypothetical protein
MTYAVTIDTKIVNEVRKLLIVPVVSSANSYSDIATPLFWNPYSFRIRYVASLLSVQALVNASDHSGLKI